MTRRTVISRCPGCGKAQARETYDIGSGPELCCSNCETCWGADGQQLQPLDVDAVIAEVAKVPGFEHWGEGERIRLVDQPAAGEQ